MREVKSFFITFFLFFFFTNLLYAKVESDGFLGVSLTGSWLGGVSKFDTPVLNNTAGLSFGFIGVASEYDIITEINFIDDIIHVADYYRGKKDFLSKGQLYPFSFADFSLHYSIKKFEKQKINLLLGLQIGHLGYISTNFIRNPWTIYLSPVFSFWYFFHPALALHNKFDFPIGTYRSNSYQLWHIRDSIELVYEPYGRIENPLGTSALFSLGMEFQYIYLSTKEEGSQSHSIYFRPYFKFTLLY